MRTSVLVGTLALASLLVVPSCVDDLDDGGDLDLGSTEALLSSGACPPGTPAALAPAADQDLAFVLEAAGVQKYTCTAPASATGPAWTFVAPQANLLAPGGEPVGTHYAGPTWEYEDGSLAVGTKVASVTVNPAAIPWLLLAVSSHGDAPGRMMNVTAIQRLVTVGGNAPPAGCDAAHAGATIPMPYRAKYYFYRTRPNHPQSNTRCGAPS